MTADERTRVRAAVAASRRQQGLDEHVTDARVLDELAAALAAAQAKGGADAAS